jgi:dipeptidyl-peptidase-3
MKNNVPNYDLGLLDPLTNSPVGRYKDNETWNGVFGEISSGYEECKADSVAIYLSINTYIILELFRLL